MLRLFRPHIMALAATLVLVVVGVLAGIAVPFLIRAIFDRALFSPAGVRRSLLLELTGLFAVLAVVQALAGFGIAYMTVRVGQLVVRDLRNELFAALNRLPLALFTTVPGGEMQSRLNNDINGVLYFLTNVSPTLISGVMTLVGVLVAMFALNWQLAVTSLFVLPPFVVSSYVVGNRKRAATTARQERYADMSSFAQESLTPSAVLHARVFDRVSDAERRYQDASLAVMRASIRQWLAGTVQMQIAVTLFALVPGVAFLTAGFLHHGRHLPAVTAGTLAAFITLQARLYWPLTNLLQLVINARSSLAIFERIFDYTDREPDAALAGTVTNLEAMEAAEVDLRNVRFSYSPQGDAAVRGVDLRIAPGSVVAFVGQTGSGKTTLAHLIAGLYRPTDGHVRIAGVDVSSLELRPRARLVTLASQDVFLFHDTVRANLTFANRDASEADLVAAAQAAQIHERIMALPYGYDTVVGERGYALSAGERQRLALARVLLSRARVVILDETTSSLDTETENLVQTTVTRLLRGRATVIVIAHRLRLARDADVIHVFERGRIVESGTHERLLRDGSRYAWLAEYDRRGIAVDGLGAPALADL